MKKLLWILLLIVNQTWAKNDMELGLYFIPSPFGIDWSTPSTLAVSAAKNRFALKSHFMGHVWVELKCGNDHELTGMIGHNPDYLNQLLITQRGLGVLYHSFDGRLEDKKDIELERNELYKEGRINFVKFKLNEGQCKRAFQYLDEYRKHNVGRYYGLANRPLYGEGSGCSAFGASFVDLLNIIDQEMKDSWSHSVNIPLELAGPPLRDEGVNLLKIMMNSRSWAKDTERYQTLSFWDPDKMFNWVKKKVELKQPGYSVVKIQNAMGIEMDKSYLPVPLEPIWRKEPNLRQPAMANSK